MALVGFAATFEFARKEPARGHLTPAGGWARVAATSFAVVSVRAVEPGDLVEHGDVLFELAPSDGLGRGLTVEQRLLDEIEGRRAALETERELVDSVYGNSRERIVRQDAFERGELAQLRTELRLHESRLVHARRRHQDGKRLYESGALSAADLMALADDVRSRALPVVATKRELERLRLSLDSTDRRLDRAGLEARQGRATIDGQLHRLAMEESQVRRDAERRILAPRSGVVASIRVRAGDRVEPGQPLLDILPEEEHLQARLFAPTTAMGVVEVGQEVRLFLDAFPYHRYGAPRGRVVAISESTLSPGEASPNHGLVPLFRIDVEFLEGLELSAVDTRLLRPGMTVSADLVRSHGTLIDWVIEPLRGAKERI